MVDKENLEVKARVIGEKTRYVVRKGKGADWDDVPEDMQSVSCLNDEEIVEIAKLAMSLEERLGCPQDVEWASDRDLPFPQNISPSNTSRESAIQKPTIHNGSNR